MADTNMITDAVDKFEKLPTGGKVAVVGITAGVAVVGIMIANRRAASTGTTSGATPGVSGESPLSPSQLFNGSGVLPSGGIPSGDTFTGNGGVPLPPVPSGQTGTIPTPAPSGTSGMSNNFHVIQVGSATQFKTLADVAKYAGGGTWNPSTVFNYRNNSQIFQALGMTANNPNAPIPASSVSISI